MVKRVRLKFMNDQVAGRRLTYKPLTAQYALAQRGDSDSVRLTGGDIVKLSDHPIKLLSVLARIEGVDVQRHRKVFKLADCLIQFRHRSPVYRFGKPAGQISLA